MTAAPERRRSLFPWRGRWRGRFAPRPADRPGPFRIRRGMRRPCSPVTPHRVRNCRPLQSSTTQRSPCHREAAPPHPAAEDPSDPRPSLEAPVPRVRLARRRSGSGQSHTFERDGGDSTTSTSARIIAAVRTDGVDQAELHLSTKYSCGNNTINAFARLWRPTHAGLRV